ncbi:hypothetical protein JMJ35_010040 [Cladonia borealis]|uniref:Uncharacterized protein n=1 Tax=Cladonia borealis TaxID=184061 RepID=A0AA39QQX8_9LECA|nr:hypothetical protein JMJ35_010040 [Cladonia borealis]
MDLMGTHESHACSHCGKAAKMGCVGCKGMPDGSQGQMEVRYSRQEPGKAIYRAGELAKAVSHVFNRTKYKMIIKEVKKFSDVWIIYPPSEYKGSKCVLQPFPSGLFSNKQEADAILEYHNCNAVLDHLHGFLRCLLTGLFAEVDEVVHFTKNNRFRLMRAYNTGDVDVTDYSHNVIRITLKNGDKYIMDLTGAQYGWQETVTPCDMYQQAKIRQIREVLPFWGTRQFCKERAEKTGEMAQWQHDIDVDFETVLNDLLKSWQQGNMLLETLEAGLQSYKKFMTENGAFDAPGNIVVGGFDKNFTDVTGKAIN